MSPKVLVTPRSLTTPGLDASPALRRLRDAGFTLVASAGGRQPSPDELRDLLPGCVAWIAGVEPIGEDILASAPDLRVISRYGSGTDAIDAEAASRRGVIVERVVGGNAQSVAELALALVLSALRGIAPASRALADGRWERTIGRELGECTVGVVGLGAIGGIVARSLSALGATVVAHDPAADAIAVGGHVARCVSLDELIDASDIVTLHCPSLPDGKPLLSRPEFARMRPNSVLINTSRASLVDDAAVLEALDGGVLMGYAVDAFDTEPPSPSPLLTHPQVIATPHIGALTNASTERTVGVAVDNLLRHVAAP